MSDDFKLDGIQGEGNSVFDAIIGLKFSFISRLSDSRIRIICQVADIGKIGDIAVILDRYCRSKKALLT